MASSVGCSCQPTRAPACKAQRLPPVLPGRPACRQRFSLLFYGFGSKRSLLEAFADETLTDGGVLACDGLAPGVNAKQVRSSGAQDRVRFVWRCLLYVVSTSAVIGLRQLHARYVDDGMEGVCPGGNYCPCGTAAAAGFVQRGPADRSSCVLCRRAFLPCRGVLRVLQVLQAVASALTHRSCKSQSHSELLSLICSEPACRQLYVLLHNIDGPGAPRGVCALHLSRANFHVTTELRSGQGAQCIAAV